MTSNTFFFDSVWVLESLAFVDRFGEQIVDDLRAHALHAGINTQLHYRAIESKSDFAFQMEEISRQVAVGAHSPILQLNLHGSDAGFAFNSGEFVTWGEVAHMFARINVISELNLLVLMASCDGASLLKVLVPSQPAPVWGLIGPIRAITVDEAATAYTAFYKELFSTLDGGVAWRHMNDSIVEVDRPFAFYSCAMIFRYVFRGYHATECTPAALDARLAKIEGWAQDGGASPDQILAARPHMREELSNLRSPFNHCRHKFFMIDRFPENGIRFTVTLEECLLDCETQSSVPAGKRGAAINQ